MVDVGTEIKRRREEQKISQNQLAKLSGCAQSTLSAIEKTTKKPSTETLRGIAAALGCTVAELMGESSDQSQGPVLNPQDRELLRIFHLISGNGRESVMNFAKYTLIQENKEKENFISSVV